MRDYAICRTCGEVIKPRWSKTFKRISLFSAIRKHYWDKHFYRRSYKGKVGFGVPKKGVIPPQFLKHPPPTWRKAKRVKGVDHFSESPNPPVRGRRRVRGKRALGNIGLKGLLAGIAGLTVGRIINRKLGSPIPPAYEDGAVMTGVGLAGHAIKQLGTKHLTSSGLILLGSSLIADLVQPQGLVTLPTVGVPTVYDV